MSGLGARALNVLLAHGAGTGSDANRRVAELARKIERLRPGESFTAAFNLGSPRYPELLRATGGTALTVLPLLTSDGWFARRWIAAQSEQAEGPLRVAPPLGILPSVCAGVTARVAEALRNSADMDVRPAVLVVAHGTTRDARSSAAAEAVADAVRIASPELRAARCAFLDQEPGIEEQAAALLVDGPIIVVPFLLGGGDHALRDLPARLSIARGRVRMIEPLAEWPELPALVLELLDLTAARLPMRLGTRGSSLALRQAESAASALGAAGAPTITHILDTEGDRDNERPLDAFESDGPFTDDLERALVAGEIDVAVHSLKDLPLPWSRATSIAAVLPRGSIAEVLVTRDRRALSALPAGSVIGTSSPRRAAQLSRLRPDLETRPIRGNVEERVRQVMTGRFDGAILAEAGLERVGLEGAIAERFAPDVFVPQACQGAIALQTRANDWFAESLCARVSDEATWRAVSAEAALAERVEASGLIAAAAAEVTAEGNVRLHGLALARDGTLVEEFRW